MKEFLFTLSPKFWKAEGLAFNISPQISLGGWLTYGNLTTLVSLRDEGTTQIFTLILNRSQSPNFFQRVRNKISKLF